MHTEDEPERSAADFDPRVWPFFWASQMVGLYLQMLEFRLKRDGLDVSRYRVLMSVGTKHMNITEIAEQAIVKLPTMMKIIQRMETEGLVISQPRATDGRFTDVSLTKLGYEKRMIAWQIAKDLYDKSFTGINKRDEAKLNTIMSKVWENLRGK